MNEYFFTLDDTLQLAITNKGGTDLLAIFIPFFSAIAGGVIVLLGQFFKQRHDLKKEIKSTLIELLTEYSANILIMNYQLKELAMHKFHTQYWWYSHITSEDNDYKIQYYNKHIESQQMAFKTESAIYSILSKLLTIQTKFEKITKIQIPGETPTYQEFEKAKTYDKNIPKKKLRFEMAEKDERELREKYFNRLKVYEIKYTAMQETFDKNYK